MTKDKTKLTMLINEAGIKAAEIAERDPTILAQEEAFFIAGFQECVKWLDLQDKIKLI